MNTEVLKVMNDSLVGTDFRIDAQGTFLLHARTLSVRVVIKGKRVQCRDSSTDRLYWSGPASNIRNFVREFWLAS